MELVFATHNEHKVKELRALLPKSINLKSLTDIGCQDEIIEDAPTLEGNALIKANYVKEHFGLACFADDTGLEVDALGGDPGVYSARYAGPQKNAQDNMDKLLAVLKDRDNRKAQFRTVFALVGNDEPVLLEGICRGTITYSPAGNQGFGYDPIFKPEGFSQTFAQMSLENKGKISHRGKAVQALITYLKENA